MLIRLFLVLLISLTSPCFALRTLWIENGYVYEMYEPQDEIPLKVLNEGASMYLDAYLNPRLHEGISLKTLQLDETKFTSYDEFIADMCRCDFISYQWPNAAPRFYLQARKAEDGRVVGVCALFEQAPGIYYIDHIGVDKGFRRQKIARTLITQMVKNIGVFKEVSLDTRVFNKPAQSLYESLGFKKLAIHPLPAKQSTYFHYLLIKNP